MIKLKDKFKREDSKSCYSCCEIPEIGINNETMLTDLYLELLQKGREYLCEMNNRYLYTEVEIALKEILHSYMSSYDLAKEYDVKVLDMGNYQYCIDLIPLTENAFKLLCNIDEEYKKNYVWDMYLGVLRKCYNELQNC